MLTLLRILSLVAAFILSSITISKEPGIDFGFQGLKGLPIPYDYAVFPTFPSSQNNLLYAIDFFFWIIILNLAINFTGSRRVNKTSNNRRLFSKDFFYTFILSAILFGVLLVARMAF